MERTNITDKGYTYNGQNYVNQDKVDSQGNNYTVALPSTISSSSISAPQATIPVTQPTYNTGTQQTQAAQAGAYTGSTYSDAQTQADAQLKVQQDAYTTANSDLGKLQSSMGGKGADLVTAYNTKDEAGNSVNSLAGKLRALNARSMALGLDNQAKTQDEINKATGQNITQGAVTRNIADATRENLINQASIAIQSATVNADYQTAKSYADQIVDAKYDQKLADIEAAKTNIKNAEFTYTAAEKKVAEATTARLNKEKQDYEKKKADETAINATILKASQGGAPKDLLDTVQKGVMDGTLSPAKADIMLGQYTAAIPASAQEYQYAVTHGYKGSYSEYQTQDANRKALASRVKGTTTSGGLNYSPQDMAEDSKILETSRGPDGHVDPTIYQNLYKAWVSNGGLLKDFLAKFPPKNYVNPANTWLPSFLMPTTSTPKKSSGTKSTINDL